MIFVLAKVITACYLSFAQGRLSSFTSFLERISDLVLLSEQLHLVVFILAEVGVHIWAGEQLHLEVIACFASRFPGH